MMAVAVIIPASLLVVMMAASSAEQKNITVGSGQDVTLTCRAPNSNILVLEWSRADLGSEYVLLYRDGRLEPDNQHPSFKNRVDLQDRQKKDGDVSLILKNVTINDAGTYECRVVQRAREPLKLISIIYLRVSAPPGPPGGSAGLIVGLIVAALLVVVVVISIKKRRILSSLHLVMKRLSNCGIFIRTTRV